MSMRLRCCERGGDGDKVWACTAEGDGGGRKTRVHASSTQMKLIRSANRKMMSRRKPGDSSLVSGEARALSSVGVQLCCTRAALQLGIAVPSAGTDQGGSFCSRRINAASRLALQDYSLKRMLRMGWAQDFFPLPNF